MSWNRLNGKMSWGEVDVTKLFSFYSIFTLFFYLLKFYSVFWAAIHHGAVLLLNFFLLDWPKVSSLPSETEDAPVMPKDSEKSMTADEFVAFSGNNLSALCWASWWAFLQPYNRQSYLPQRRGQKAVFLLATARGDLL